MMHDELLLKKWPKIDLHRHLEGAVRPLTFLELAKERNILIPVDDLEGILPYLIITGEENKTLNAFREKLETQRKIFVDKEALLRITAEAVEDAVQDNVRYLELRFDPARMVDQGIAWNDIIKALEQGIRTGKNEHTIEVVLICGIDRTLDLTRGEQVINFAVQNQDKGIVALDIVGDESISFEKFYIPLKKAVTAGLGVTVHAGEKAVLKDIQTAIQLLGARRIGDGVKITEDVAIDALARREGIMLEICPTSSVETGAVATFAEHPLKNLFNTNLPVSINSNAPSVLSTTLTQEYFLVCTKMGISLFDLQQIILSSIDFIFVEELKEPLRRQFIQEFNIWNRLN